MAVLRKMNKSLALLIVQVWEAPFLSLATAITHPIPPSPTVIYYCLSLSALSTLHQRGCYCHSSMSGEVPCFPLLFCPSASLLVFTSPVAWTAKRLQLDWTMTATNWNCSCSYSNIRSWSVAVQPLLEFTVTAKRPVWTGLNRWLCNIQCTHFCCLKQAQEGHKWIRNEGDMVKIVFTPSPLPPHDQGWWGEGD